MFPNTSTTILVLFFLQVSEGYFVHFFAPENLPPIGKRIVFVLDTSGSMSGRKNLQLREALLFILGELRPVDEFAILLFSNTVTAWNSEGLIPAIAENIARAKQFATTIGASGGELSCGGNISKS